MSRETVRVPDIGGVDAAEVAELLVAVGDVVELEQGLLVLESDKASLEVPAPQAGTIVELLVSEGATLSEGDPVAVIDTGVAASDDAEARSTPVTTEPEADDSTPTPGEPADPAASAGHASGEVTVVPVPDLAGDDTVDLVELTVAEGDAVAEGDTLAVLESDKASVEVPSPAAGTVTRLLASVGQSLRGGEDLLELRSQTSGESPKRRQAEASPAADAPAPAATAAPGSGSTPSSFADGQAAPSTPADAQPALASASAPVYAGPAVRRLAREFSIPLEAVRGSGPRGRILKEDLHRYARQAMSASASPATGVGALPQVPEVDFAQFGVVEVVERSRIDRATADNMRRSWLTVPQVTQFDDADITELEAFRKSLREEAEQRGSKLSPLPFLIRACASALERHEKVNASLSDGGSTLTVKRYVHIGIAVDTPAGLVVPVIRDANRKSLWELAAEVADLAARARDRKLTPAEMQGASFSISSLGAIGGRGFTPIVNTPEVAILGVGRASMAPVWDGQAFQPRLQLPLALSYDHRVVNGGDAGRFLTELKALLEDIRRLLL